ncbi:polyisoprenoid-binding protein YceI [Chitinophaga dinghuensis]|uniref:Polyisoprenoid-binding protein YceI n=1 Tax=Chitinophaga dinghuensis TaxID=1539050 RepID=A0A327VWA3_9BACT|nr:YceI family protein [Chitinophaga dinghuensis]RAJ80277.1 polyisoprenoid-binding protein YceI [Chitinophaga dinghuensis]
MQKLASLLFIGGAILMVSHTLPAVAKDGKKKATTHTVVAKAATFQVDAKQSKLNWVGKKVTGQHSGTINIASGSLALENNVLKSGNFSLDTRSIAVTDIKDADGNAKLVGHLKADDFFSVEKYPTSDFVITSLKAKGNGAYDVTGNLTIKGITNPITFPANVTVNGNNLVAKANITVDRTKYNIKYGSKNFFAGIGDKAIYDEFELEVTLVANAK